MFTLRTRGEGMLLTLAKITAVGLARRRVRRVPLSVPSGGIRFEHLASCTGAKRALLLTPPIPHFICFRDVSPWTRVHALPQGLPRVLSW